MARRALPPRTPIVPLVAGCCPPLAGLAGILPVRACRSWQRLLFWRQHVLDAKRPTSNPPLLRAW